MELLEISCAQSLVKHVVQFGTFSLVSSYPPVLGNEHRKEVGSKKYVRGRRRRFTSYILVALA